MRTRAPDQIDPHSAITVHSKGLSRWFLLCAALLFALGAGVVLTPGDKEAAVMISGVACLFFGALVSWAMYATRARAEQPLLTLSPQGLRFERSDNGLIDWSEVRGARKIHIQRNAMLLVSVPDAVLQRLQSTTLTRSMAQADRVLMGKNNSGVTLPQNIMDWSIDDVVAAIQSYHIVHANPARQRVS